ncbi:MAG: tetratricopeptide repeat protein, partial [Bacteroidota bacterium]
TSFSRLLDYEKALKYKQKVVDMRRKIFGKDHLEIAYAQRSVGELHSYLGQQKRARQQLKAALKMCDRLLEKSSRGHGVLRLKARLLNGMGVSFDKEHNYEAALPYKRDSLAVNQDLYKDAPEHPAVGHSLHGLGETLIRTGQREDLAAGLSYCRKALALREQIDKKRDNENEHTANSRNWVGIALTKQGQAEGDSKKVEEGLQHSQQALAAFDKLYADQHDHPYVTSTLENIIQSLKYLARTAESGAYQQRLEMLQKRFGSGSVAVSSM